MTQRQPTMSKQSKREYLRRKRWEYRLCIDRRQKHEIISELMLMCEISNKHTIHLLNTKDSTIAKSQQSVYLSGFKIPHLLYTYNLTYFKTSKFRLVELL